MRAAAVVRVQVLQPVTFRTCFKLYCMFYFTCDHSLNRTASEQHAACADPYRFQSWCGFGAPAILTIQNGSRTIFVPPSTSTPNTGSAVSIRHLVVVNVPRGKRHPV